MSLNADKIFPINNVALYDGSNGTDILAALNPASISEDQITIDSETGGVLTFAYDSPTYGVGTVIINTGDYVSIQPGSNFISSYSAAYVTNNFVKLSDL